MGAGASNLERTRREGRGLDFHSHPPRDAPGARGENSEQHPAPQQGKTMCVRAAVPDAQPCSAKEPRPLGSSGWRDWVSQPSAVSPQ